MLLLSISFKVNAVSTCEGIFNFGKERQTNVYASLYKAMKDDYAVQVFTKDVNGRPRTLVLMGETHIKNKTSAAVGREVINNFDYVGVEGFDSEKTWGGRFKSKVITPITTKIRIKDKPQFWLARLIGKIFGKSGRTEVSTITEAVIAETRNNIINNLKSMSSQDLSHFISTLEEIPEKSKDSDLSVNGVSIFTIREIIDLAKFATNGQDLPTVNGPKETFHLEDGHKPDLWENLNSIDGYLTIGLLAGYYTASAFIPPDVALKSAYALSSFSLYQISGLLLSTSKYQTERWYQRLFPMSLGIIRGRNSTMVNNIESTFNGRQEVDQLLAIVGKLHVPEMKLLLEKMGYKSVALPEPIQMQMQDAIDFTPKAP